MRKTKTKPSPVHYCLPQIPPSPPRIHSTIDNSSAYTLLSLLKCCQTRMSSHAQPTAALTSLLSWGPAPLHISAGCRWLGVYTYLSLSASLLGPAVHHLSSPGRLAVAGSHPVSPHLADPDPLYLQPSPRRTRQKAENTLWLPSPKAVLYIMKQAT